MKLSGEVGVSVAMLPFSGGQRSSTGSVWVRVVSAIGSWPQRLLARRLALPLATGGAAVQVPAPASSRPARARAFQESLEGALHVAEDQSELSLWLL